jgi:hypothetical protein
VPDDTGQIAWKQKRMSYLKIPSPSSPLSEFSAEEEAMLSAAAFASSGGGVRKLRGGKLEGGTFPGEWPIGQSGAVARAA